MAVTIAPQILFGRCSGATVVHETITRYNSFPHAGGDFNTSPTLYRTPSLAAGRYRNFLIRLLDPPGLGKSHQFILEKDGADTVLSITISGTSVEEFDATNVIEGLYGSEFQWKHVPNGSPDQPGVIEWTCEFEPTLPGRCVYGGYTDFMSTVPAVSYNALMAPTAVAGWRSTLDDPGWYVDVIAVPGVLNEYGVQHAPITNGVVYHVYLWKSTVGAAPVRQDGTGGTVNSKIIITGNGAIQRWTKVIDLELAEEDYIFLEAIHVSGVLATFPPTCTVFCRFTSTEPGTFNIPAHSNGFAVGGFAAVSGNSLTGGEDASLTESDVEVQIGLTPLFIDGATVYVPVAFGTTHSVGYQVRKNGANAGLNNVVMTDDDTMATAGGPTASYAYRDTFDMAAIDLAGAPTGSQASYTLKGRSSSREDALIGTIGPYVWVEIPDTEPAEAPS